MGIRGGHPSRVTPTPPPWDSPQVEMRKRRPNELPVPMVRVKASDGVVDDVARRKERMENFMLDVVVVEVYYARLDVFTGWCFRCDEHKSTACKWREDATVDAREEEGGRGRATRFVSRCTKRAVGCLRVEASGVLFVIA